MAERIVFNNGPACRCCDGASRRGVVYVNTPDGPYGIAFCPRCDFAHSHAAGPPIEARARDFDPKP